MIHFSGILCIVLYICIHDTLLTVDSEKNTFSGN